ncbi:hypothetical protein [Geobacter sp. AOG1]|uniref:hypothetical protein n=1 Tax=Geobacter sp. AOG1 TaxID=1566346 RepID=UPI001CC701FF|nr:hypothetical protein [Geobacter sp. AOG1]GFE57763.1 hypothetical protein AOG1_16430 [Geobacter sp. AOG1]
MRIRHDIYLRLLTTLLCAIFLQLSPLSAHAKLSGEAELGYVKYDSKTNGVTENDARSFQQRYSLLYSTSNLLAGGRVGGYNISLGYEWAAFNTKMKTPNPATDVSLSANRGHVLYEGEIFIDPKELPFQFKAFSRDLNRIQFNRDTVMVGNRAVFADDLVTPNLTTDIIDGTRIESGATLLLGVRNGLTNGYNEIFRYFPMLLVDYRDEINHDPKSLSPVDTRLSRLAFVSLNKKDNWFHYRTSKFSDYLNPFNDWTEKAFQIGTVDQNMGRRWISFTNWINLSADGTFTKRDAKNTVNSVESYDLNLFGIAKRQNWEARTYSTFRRSIEDQNLIHEANLPLYANGDLSPETDWRFRFYDHEKKQANVTNPLERDSDLLASLQVNTFKRSSFTLTPTLSVERYDSITGNTLAVEGSVETTSTRRFSSVYGLYGRYSGKYFDSNQSGRTTGTYTNQEIEGRASYRPSNIFFFEAGQLFQVGSGTNPGNSGGSAVVVNSGFGDSTTSKFWRTNGTTINDYVRSVTTLKGSWSPAARLQVSLSLTEDVLTASGQPVDYITRVTNTISYGISAFSMRVSSSYSRENTGSASNDWLESSGLVTYQPNRFIDASLNYHYTREKRSDQTTTFVNLVQKFNYYLYRTNGVSRRLLELNEEINYNENSTDFGSAAVTSKSILLGARYYPLRNFFLAGNARYTLTDPGGFKAFVYSASTGITYSMLQVSLDYTYGNQDGNLNFKRVEKRFSANLKKFF